MSNITARLASLRDEFERGKRMLADLEREAEEVRAGLLRITGAIQVLEELEAEGSANPPGRES